MRTLTGRRLTLPLAALALALALAALALAISASEASAVIIKLPGGRTYSYQPLRGTARNFDTVFGNVDYNGGPVMASNTNYTLYWMPSSYAAPYPVEYQPGVNQFFADLAHDSGGNQNVDSVSAQYNDTSGNFASYRSNFGGALIDTDPYPVSGCPSEVPSGGVCLTDSQIQAELGKFIDAQGLPRDLTHEYFLLTPPGVESCLDSTHCSANALDDPYYCAYHSNSLAQPVFIYADDPYVTDNRNCDDGNHPNGQSDGALEGGLSHEHNESITDPLPNASWTDIAGGEEIGDKCSGTMGDPIGTAPNGSPYNQVINGHFYWYQEEWSNAGSQCLQRFTPSGGVPTAAFSSTAETGASMNFDASASTGPIAEYNWQFNDGPGLSPPFEQPTPTIGHQFPSSDPFVVALTTFGPDGTSAGAAGIVTPGQSGATPGFSSTPNPGQGQPVSFTGLATLGGLPVTDYIWDFGDGSAAGAGATTSHAYSALGSYKVTLTMFGPGGGVVTSQPVTVDEPPNASFALTTAHPATGHATTFNGSASSDPDGAIVAYRWDFGDGSAGSGATPSHVYTAERAYTVTLTVTDSSGLQAAQSQQLTVDEAPRASISVRTKHPVTGSAVHFDGSLSTDPDGSIIAYSWNYGDGTAVASGSSPRHTYRKHGTHRVTLTVTDSAGISSSTTALVLVVRSAKIRKVSVRKLRDIFYLLVKVTGPGQVKLGSQRVRLTNAGTAKFKLGPGSGRRLKLKLKLKFTPIAGAVERETVRIGLP
jgi:PKD repeat protein